MENYAQKNDPLCSLLKMEDKEFFAESVMFLFGKMMGVAKGTTTAEEYQQSKSLIDEMFQARKLAAYSNKPLPKYPERGWMFPYLYEGDRVFGPKRWEWWTNCFLAEKIEGPIPQIDFHLHSAEPKVQEAIQHIEKILIKLETMIGISSSLMTLISWILWGVGSKRIEECRWSEEVDRYLYENIELGRLQVAPFDYFAWFAQQTRGNGRWSNPNNFYQTPPTVSRAMAQMLFADNQNITASVCDPCAGTGTLLLFASNYSVNLHGVDIAWDLCAMCEANGFLYMPFLVKPAPWLVEKQIEVIPKKEAKCIPGRKRIIIDNKPIEYHEKKGQLTLFEI